MDYVAANNRSVYRLNNVIAGILGSSFLFFSMAEVPSDRNFRVYAGDLDRAELKANYGFTSTLVARREAAGEAVWFAEDLPTFEDRVCFGRLARAGTAAYLDCETAWQHGHGGPRLTGTDALRTASARLAAAWGQDPQLLEQHRAEYESALSECHIACATAMISEGRTGDARRELRAAGSVPWFDRLAACLPRPHRRSPRPTQQRPSQPAAPRRLAARSPSPPDSPAVARNWQLAPQTGIPIMICCGQ